MKDFLSSVLYELWKEWCDFGFFLYKGFTKLFLEEASVYEVLEHNGDEIR